MADQIWEVSLRAQDQFSNVISQGSGKAGAAVRKLESDVRDADRHMSRMGSDTRGLSTFQRNVQGARQTLSQIGNIMTGVNQDFMMGQGFANFVGEINELGAGANKADRAFEQLTRNIGGANEVMETLRRSTGGVVNDMDLAVGANQLLGIGIASTKREVNELASGAVLLGSAFGKNASEAINEFSLMMANESIPRLDTFGISAANVRKRIQELQASGEALNRSEGFKMAVLEQMEVTKERLGDVEAIAITNADRVGTAIQNIVQNVAQGINDMVNTGAGGIVGVADLLSGAGAQRRGRNELQSLTFTNTGVAMAEGFHDSLDTQGIGSEMANAFAQEIPDLEAGGQRFTGFQYGRGNIGSIFDDIREIMKHERDLRQLADARVEQFNRLKVDAMPSVMQALLGGDVISHTMDFARLGANPFPGGRGASPDVQLRMGTRGLQQAMGFAPDTMFVTQGARNEAFDSMMESITAWVEFSDQWEPLTRALGTGGSGDLDINSSIQGFIEMYTGAFEEMERWADKPFVPQAVVDKVEGRISGLSDLQIAIEDLITEGLPDDLGTGVLDTVSAVQAANETWLKSVKTAYDVPLQTLIEASSYAADFENQRALAEMMGISGLDKQLGVTTPLQSYLMDELSPQLQMAQQAGLGASSSQYDVLSVLRDVADEIRRMSNIGMSQQSMVTRLQQLNLGQQISVPDYFYSRGQQAPWQSRIGMSGLESEQGFSPLNLSGRNASILAFQQSRIGMSGLGSEQGFSPLNLASRNANLLADMQVRIIEQTFSAEERLGQAREEQLAATRELAAETEHLSGSLAALTGKQEGGAFGQFTDLIMGMLPEDMQEGFGRAAAMASGRETTLSRFVEEELATVMAEVSKSYGADFALGRSQEVISLIADMQAQGADPASVMGAARSAAGFTYTGGGQRNVEVRPGWGRLRVEQEYGKLTPEEWASITDARGGLHPGSFAIGGAPGRLQGVGVAPALNEFQQYGQQQTTTLQTELDAINTSLDTAVVSMETINETELDVDTTNALEALETFEEKLKDIVNSDWTVAVGVEQKGGGSIPGGLPRPSRGNDPRVGQSVSVDGVNLHGL